VDASYKKILWRSNIFSVKSVNLAEGDKRAEAQGSADMKA
jgi:hypothetical protein